MKTLLCIAAIIVCLAFLSCNKENREVKNIYTLSNQVANNEVLMFSRAANGALTYKASYATNGTGTGATLGSQGALAISKNRQWLFAVNAGSNEISVFRVAANGSLSLTDKKGSGGTTPISITNYNNLLYVLNGGSTPNISGFFLNTSNGSLTPIPLSTRQLPEKVSGPAQVSFTDDGSALVITEKAVSKILSYNLIIPGIPGTSNEIASASPTPFGFAVGRNNNVFVSEAGQGALSVYHIGSSSVSLLDGPKLTNQKAACWAVITDDGKYVYVANAASNSITGYSVGLNNHVTLLNASGVTATTGNGPLDETLAADSKFLYVLNSGSHNISGYNVRSDGSLEPIGTFGMLPTGAISLAAQ
jgi:6-phosphogluconolactonase (cycloisomerase 2 family)